MNYICNYTNSTGSCFLKSHTGSYEVLELFSWLVLSHSFEFSFSELERPSFSKADLWFLLFILSVPLFMLFWWSLLHITIYDYFIYKFNSQNLHCHWLLQALFSSKLNWYSAVILWILHHSLYNVNLMGAVILSVFITVGFSVPTTMPGSVSVHWMEWIRSC